MFIPAKVEEKIRYLCRKFPNLEWSGILFTRHTGSFEDGTLEIHCEDIYPMDLGSQGFTQFKMDETVAAYIADNIELFDCDVQLVHSHNVMSAFFSGQDQATLREEGNEKNCFVSLIVNNAGEYCAAVTRKLQTKKQVITHGLGVSYEFFGEGSIHLNAPEPTEEIVVDDAVIEYYMLDIQKETVENPLSYLDKRFDEIEEKKAQARRNYIPTVKTASPWWDSTEDTQDMSFKEWQERNKEPKVTQQYLFSKDVMEEDIDNLDWSPNPENIKDCIVKMICCSLIVDSKRVDLETWVKKYMMPKYRDIFKGIEGFTLWSEPIVEFLVENYEEEGMPEVLHEDIDYRNAIVAEAMYDALSVFAGNNEYISGYMDILRRYF